MYRVIYRNDYQGTYVVVGTAGSVRLAGELRAISGDLVVDLHGKVVDSAEWLFDWEKKDKTCYAQRMRGQYVVGLDGRGLSGRTARLVA